MVAKRPNRTRGRPANSSAVRIVPVPHPVPDARRLGQALLALALHQAELEASSRSTKVDEEPSDEVA